MEASVSRVIVLSSAAVVGPNTALCAAGHRGLGTLVILTRPSLHPWNLLLPSAALHPCVELCYAGRQTVCEMCCLTCLRGCTRMAAYK